MSGPNDHFQTDRQSRTSAATTPETGELLTHGYSNQKAPQIPVAIMSATSNQGMMGLSKMLVVSAVDFGIITGSYITGGSVTTLSHRRLTHSPVGDEVHLNDCDSRVCPELHTFKRPAVCSN